MCEKREKLKKSFLNLEKKRGIQCQIRKLIVNEKEISDKNRINTDIELFYETLFKKNQEKSFVEHAKILDTLPLAALDESEALLCQGGLTEKELNAAMMSMVHEKTPQNDGLTKKFLGRIK